MRRTLVLVRENISNFGVEREATAHPNVLEAACVTAPSPIGGDDEVKVFVVVDRDLAMVDLWHFLAERIPHFMVPRYLEVLDELPKTPTSRVKKHALRAHGNSSATWDSDQHGLRATRRGVVSTHPRRDVRVRDSGAD